MIAFTDILLGSALPLHPYLIEQPSLSIRLIVDGNICGETPPVNGDLTSGIWDINSGLRASSVEQSVTLAVVASKNGLRIRFASVKLSVVELLTRVKAQSGGYQEFTLVDTSSSMLLLMTCVVKASRSFVVDSPSSSVVVYGNQAIDRRGGEAQSNNSKLPSRDTQLAKHAQNLAITLIDRFRQSGNPVDIEGAISHLETALKFTEDLDEDKPRLLGNLGSALQLRSKRLGDLAGLGKSISCYRQAIELIPDWHPNKPALLKNLGIALKSRFDRLGSLSDLEEAVSGSRKAVDLTPDGHPDKPGLLNELGDALQLRFGRLGSLVDIHDAISNQQKAVEFTPDGHPHKPRWLSELGNSLRQRFERLGSPVDLEGAISNHQKAIQLVPDGHPDKPGFHNDLGGAFQYQFECLGRLADLENAIWNKQVAIKLTPPYSPDQPTYLYNLGTALLRRFERLGSTTDMDDAISNLQKAVELTADGHPNQPGRLSGLGAAFQLRFERLGSLIDIDNAISNQKKAVERTPDGHPGKPLRLSNLGGALRRRFEGFGSITDIDDAIWNLQTAVNLTPDGHTDKPNWLGNLGAALQRRYEYLGSLADLDHAISNLKQGADLMLDGHPENIHVLTTLGSALQYRFERLDRLSDIDDAISSLQKGVKLMPEGHSYKPGLFNALGGALLCRFQRLGSLTDIEDAISGLRKAVNLTPDGHPNKPLRLHNLGGALHSRFERLGGLEDIEGAILNSQKAADLTPDGRPDKPSHLYSLGGALLARLRCSGVPGDLEDALSALSIAAKSASGSAMVRFKAARRWAKGADENSRSSLEAFSCAIDLLPRIAWLGLAMTDQHALLADVGSIVHDAVAAAIRCEEYEMAVVWAEQGRSIAWQNLLGLRSPVDDLRRAHPRLADRLQTIARQLEGSASRDLLRNEGQAVVVEDLSRRYSKLALEWDNLVDKIRRLPNFEGFLKAKSFSQLAPAAHEGPVVILNANDSRCDALVLIAEDSAERHVSVVNIPLERFSHDRSQKVFQTLTGLLMSAGVRERNDRKTIIGGSQLNPEAKFKTVLRILWQDVVKPVIEGLAFQTESKRPPRIWWCATGLLAFLPIHAAGLYDTQEIGEKAVDYVVSSYTPTLTAILDLSEPAVQEDFQILTVAQAYAPGASPIPKTEDEVRIVHRCTTGARIVDLMREDATVERVREGMMKSNWIHLACHGQQNPGDPLESGFLLHDKMLKLSEIVKMSLPKADFAFLSACQTAMGDEKVAEESVHLAAGMFLSGCRGVIATTWSIRDDDAPKIAEDVYSRIFKDGKPNRKEAAYALHEAVKQLRESGVKCTSWVPFIHIGR